MHCSWRRLFRRGLEFHVCTINKSAHTTKKSRNLSYAPRTRKQVRTPIEQLRSLSYYYFWKGNELHYCFSTRVILAFCNPRRLIYHKTKKAKPKRNKIIIIIIIIMSCHQHRYHWPSLATFPYRLSLLACLLGYIPYPPTAAVYMFEQVVLL